MPRSRSRATDFAALTRLAEVVETNRQAGLRSGDVRDTDERAYTDRVAAGQPVPGPSYATVPGEVGEFDRRTLTEVLLLLPDGFAVEDTCHETWNLVLALPGDVTFSATVMVTDPREGVRWVAGTTRDDDGEPLTNHLGHSVALGSSPEQGAAFVLDALAAARAALVARTA